MLVDLGEDMTPIGSLLEMEKKRLYLISWKLLHIEHSYFTCWLVLVSTLHPYICVDYVNRQGHTFLNL